MTLEAQELSVSFSSKWGFSYNMASLSCVVPCFAVFHGECVLLVLAPQSSGKRQQKSFIASPFLMQQGVCKCNRHAKWEVFLQFGKKDWKKRGEWKGFLSSSRNRVSDNTCMVYWARFLLNFHARGQQAEDHVSQWENLLWDTPSKWFERVWLYVQVPASARCTSLLDWAPSWSLQE